MRTIRLVRAVILSGLVALAAQGATETVLHNFRVFPGGEMPQGTLFRDGDGSLFGTANSGGSGNAGVVFQLNAQGRYRVIYNFTGGEDGGHPIAGVVRDAAGNLYGTTYYGGTVSSNMPQGAGVVYKIDQAGTYSVLYTFTGGGDGANPYAGVVLDSAGNLYGTTVQGGAVVGGMPQGAGVVYRITPAGQQTVLHSFQGDADSAAPYSGVILDDAGNLYGTTHGAYPSAAATIYELNTSGQKTILYTFGSTPHTSAGPPSGVIRDKSGNLYGTATDAVFRLSAKGEYRELAHLTILDTGGAAVAGVVRDAAGNLYGTSIKATCAGCATHAPYGGVYKVDTAGNLTLLYAFPRSSVIPAGAANPGVVLDVTGNLYGATPYGPNGGMVYKIDTAGQESMLYDLSAAAGGTAPGLGVIRDSRGNLYGTTSSGGTANAGVVFKLSAKGHETVLHNFTQSGSAGKGLAMDLAGNVYGTLNEQHQPALIFKLDTTGVYSTFYTFAGGQGSVAVADWIGMDAAGNFYGTGSGPGSLYGLIFKLDSAGNLTVLHQFNDDAGGTYPNAGLAIDAAGNVYGTTSGGGGSSNGGVVFKVDGTGNETVLHTFMDEADGGNPLWGVVLDGSGNIYGTAGGFGTLPNAQQGSGVIFKIDTDGNYTVLHTFGGGSPNGAIPVCLTIDDSRALYGATTAGGMGPGIGYGVVYKLDSRRNFTVLHSFTGGLDGSSSGYSMALDKRGNLYGSGSADGKDSGGVVYRVAP